MTCAALLLGCGDDDVGSQNDASAIADGRVNDATPVAPDSWIALTNVGAGAVQETAVAELGGLIYVVGGFHAARGIVADVLVYDPLNDRWLANAPALPAPIHHAHLVAVGNKLWVVGALTGLDFRAVGVVWSIDPITDKAWAETHTPMPAGSQRGGGAVGVIDGVIYIAGGLRDGVAVADMSAYETGSDTWNTTLTEIPAARDHLVGGVVDDVFYAIGGRDGSVSARVDAYDPTTGMWTPRRDMLTARAGCAAGVVDGNIIVAGGEGSAVDPNGVFPQTESYDPDSDEWTTLSDMRTPRHGTGGAGYSGRLYVPGGATRQGFGATAVNEAYVR